MKAASAVIEEAVLPPLVTTETAQPQQLVHSCHFLAEPGKPVDNATLFDNPASRDFISLLKEFTDKEISARLVTIEKQYSAKTFDLIPIGGAINLPGVNIPERNGGQGFPNGMGFQVLEKIARAGSVSAFIILAAQYDSAILPLLFFGNTTQQSDWLAELADGSRIVAAALRDTDAADSATTAVLSEDGKSVILNGRKRHVFSASKAGQFVVLAYLQGKGPTLFFLPEKKKGLRVGKNLRRQHLKGCFISDVTFKNVEVPLENVLGTPGRAAPLIKAIKCYTRLSSIAGITGILKKMLEDFLEYSQTALRQSRPLALQEDVQLTVYEVAKRIGVLEGMFQNVFEMIGKAFRPEKFAVETAILWRFAFEQMSVIPSMLQARLAINDAEFQETLAKLQANLQTMVFYRNGEGQLPGNISYLLLNRALDESVPLRLTMRQETAFNSVKPPEIDGEFAVERRALSIGRDVWQVLFNLAVMANGKDIRHRHQLAEMLEEMVAGLYACDSILSHTMQAMENKREHLLPPLMVQDYCIAQIDRFWQLTYSIVTELLGGAALTKAVSQLEKLELSIVMATPSLAEKRAMATSIYRAHHS